MKRKLPTLKPQGIKMQVELIEFEKEYVHEITGFKGVATAQSFYSNGCIKVYLEPRNLDKEGKPATGVWFDIQEIDVPYIVEGGGPMVLAPEI